MTLANTSRSNSDTSAVANPHDRLFRSAMSDMRVAKEFFEQYLPTTIRSAINLDSLVLCPNSYIDQSLKLSLSDVLYQVNIAGELGFIYLLCEHQSTVDVLMPFRIWQYIIAIWDDYLKQNSHKAKTLPLVVPMVFYTGDKPYNASTDVRDLIQASPKLIDEILFQPFKLIDVNAIPDEELRAHLWAGVMAFIMKHIRARDALLFLKQVIKQLRQLEVVGGTNHVVRLLNYFLAASEIQEPQTFVELIQTGLSPTMGEKIMTLAEQFAEQGYQRGRQEAMTLADQFRGEGEATLLTRQLTRKFGTVSINHQERIKQADTEKLLLWGERVLFAKTLDEVFA
jgi:predicted transposase/invertase (TIGR01784 family)